MQRDAGYYECQAHNKHAVDVKVTLLLPRRTIDKIRIRLIICVNFFRRRGEDSLSIIIYLHSLYSVEGVLQRLKRAQVDNRLHTIKVGNFRQKMLGILYRGTKLEANARNSVPNHSAEETTTRNSVPKHVSAENMLSILSAGAVFFCKTNFFHAIYILPFRASE
jgi:hypothetical protein